MEEYVKTIISEDLEKSFSAIKQFLKENSQTFKFPELDECRRSELWNALFNFLKNPQCADQYIPTLQVVCILSRDKTDLDKIINEEKLDLLLKHAGLSCETDTNYLVAVEVLKCLCNLIFNCPSTTVCICRKQTLQSILNRLKLYKNPELPHEIKYFDMKLLFLLTAIYKEITPKFQEDFHGLTYLIKTLETFSQLKGHNSDKDQLVLQQNISFINEVLKVLFNLTVTADTFVDEETEAHYVHLVPVLRTLLVLPLGAECHGHVINLLTNMPYNCYKGLLIPEVDDKVPKNLRFEQQNLEAVNVLLTHLKVKFEGIPNRHEALSPVLIVLLKCASSDRTMRKYLRLHVLPPLRDVHNRPEEGNTLRNCLCRLLTSPVSHTSELAADLLFVLCKENVNRMIKYTGYGNAAGLFAKRGLLGGGRSGDGNSAYSSDSEDSDTEEYIQHKHGINPVVGCFEEPHPNPTANMTEEQKEFEAMKLVNLIDNLTKKGVMQPCKIGEDGRPEPIDHVLQLQEGLQSLQVRRKQ